MEYNTGFYMDGTTWAVPLKDVRLYQEWVKKNVTLYRALEDGQYPYLVEVTELGDNSRDIFVTGSRIQNTTLSLKDYLRKFESLKLVE